MTIHTTLILVRDYCDYIELPWIRYSLSYFNVEETVYPVTESVVNDIRSRDIPPIVVLLISENHSQHLYSDASSLLTRSGVLYGIFHISDEWFLKSRALPLYKNSRFVLRNYFCPEYQQDKVLTLPLGCCISDSQREKVDKDVIVSPETIFFSGELKYSRRPMWFAFKDQGLRSIRDLNYDQYLSRLYNCKFALCPNGNTTPDTYRLYEALELGAIPIAETGFGYDYLDKLFRGDCPIPRFKSWKSARRFTFDLGADSEAYLNLKKSITEWWQRVKTSIPSDVAFHIYRHWIESDTTSESTNLMTHNRRLNFHRKVVFLFLLQNFNSISYQIPRLIRILSRTCRINAQQE